MNKFLLTSCVLFTCATGAIFTPPLSAETVTINTGGAIWKDTNGNQINAHGGCIIKVGDTFYWFGENQTATKKKSSGVNCYSSVDLVHWEFRRQVLSQKDPGLEDSQFERPKVLYNDKTKKFVLWAHRENLHDYSDAQAIVAQCDKPDGEYRLVKMFRPFDDKGDVKDHGKPGYMSLDCTLFQDDDGTGWFISSSNVNSDLMLYKLSPDYYDTIESYNILPQARRESPALFKRNGKYYLLTSACTSWNFNYNTLQEAEKITGPYGPQRGLITRVGDSTFNSQVCYVFPIRGSKGVTYMFMADRWKAWNLPNSRNIWLPLRFDNDAFLPMAWGDSWRINLETGEAAFPLDPEPSDDNIAKNKPVLCDKNNERNGKEPYRIVDGDKKKGWAAETGEAPQQIKIDLGKTFPLRESKITWEGNKRAYQYYIETSQDDLNWTKVVDRTDNSALAGDNNDPIHCDARYARLTITGKGDGMWFWAACEEWELISEKENVALNKKVTASSAEWGRYAEKINDGDFGAHWATNDDKPGHWAKIDLGKIVDIGACRIVWQNPGYVYRYLIEVSDDGDAWKKVIDQSANEKVVRTPVHAFNARGRYVRLTLATPDDGCWPAVAEMEVFPQGKKPPEQQYTRFRASD